MPENILAMHLKLMDEAIRRDAQFVHRHRDDYPQGLFQCLWNSGWWYDCPEAAKHYIEPDAGWKDARRGSDLARSCPGCWNAGGRKRQKRAPASGCDQDGRRGYTWAPLNRPSCADKTDDKIMSTASAFSPDGRRIARASGDHTVRLWDAAIGVELAILRGHENSVISVTYSPDGRWLASGACDKTVRLWDAASGAELAVLRGHENSVNSVEFSPDGRRIAGASRGTSSVAPTTRCGCGTP